MLRLLLVLVGGSIGSTAAEFYKPQTSMRRDPVIVTNNYHGWPGSLLLHNGLVEVTIVPAVGRVMQFGFVREEGTFWEDRELYGKLPDPKSKEWINFGGDKTWPAPQADWGKVTGRGWPPPSAFDSMPVEAKVGGAIVTLTSPVDPHFGIRTHRRIELVGRDPIMRITTRYEKVEGPERKVGIWVITQFKHPERVFAPIPASTAFRDGFNLQSDKRPPSLKVAGGLLSLERDRGGSYKIGNDAEALLWVGQRHMVLVESPRVSRADYPDNGSSAEIYTNPDPKDYVELELLGPLRSLKVGDNVEQTMQYTLLRRSPATPEEEARKILKK